MANFNLELFVIYLIINISITTCAYDNANCPESSYGLDKFIKTGPNSKYLYSPTSKAEGFKTIGEICTSMGLEIAEVRSAMDFNHLANFTLEQKITGRNWALGMTDEAEEGIFTEQGGTPIQYQAFWAHEPDNGDGGSNCIELAFIDGTNFAMFDVPCYQSAFPLCQFPKSNECNLNSPMSVLAENANSVDLVGYTASRKYFGSSMQKTWTEALVYCARNGKKLVDFLENDAEVQSLYKLAQSHIIQNGMHEFNGFWTSGKYEQEVKGGDFLWQTTDVPFNSQKISRSSWDWMPGEPNDSSDSGLEICIAYFAPTQQTVGKTSIPMLSASNCKIPLYFMCYEDSVSNVTTFGEASTLKLEDKENDEIVKPSCIADGTKAPTLTLTKPGLSTKDIVAFAEFNVKNQLQSNAVSLKVKESIKWRVPIAEVFAEITKKICPHAYVNNGFINIMKSAILIYYQSMDYAGKNIDTARWDSYLKDLTSCAKTLNPMTFEATGLAISGFVFGEGDKVARMLVNPKEETLDHEDFFPDLVIDTFWHMFTLTAGACFPSIQGRSKTEWMSDFLFYFTRDFMEKFFKRWIHGGQINYGSLIGDMDIRLSILNLRICSTSVYASNEISNLYFARTLYFENDHRNLKTGNPLFSKIG